MVSATVELDGEKLLEDGLNALLTIYFKGLS